MSEEGVFYRVVDSPEQSKTIFEFSTEEGSSSATFHLYGGAQSKVLCDSNFLDGAATIQGVGTYTAITIEDGRAEKQSNGKWFVKEKTVIKFE